MMSLSTPRALGYRMPAEWEPHAATWLSWPRRTGISFPGRHEEILPILAEMVRRLAASEAVNINIRDARMEKEIRTLLRSVPPTLHFRRIPTHEPWCRDHGPIFVKRIRGPKPRIAIVDWGYNAWGGKYPPFDLDDAVPQRVAELLHLPLFQPRMILEGGSIDVNGRGTLLTTEQCLLNQNRNPQLKKSAIEKFLRDYLGVTNILWLGEGIIGDDTDGHVDDIARFVNPRTVVAAVEEDPRDPNHAPLKDNLRRLRAMKDERGRSLRVIPLPMPPAVTYQGQRLPASYANFYIANRVVLLPTYRDQKRDRLAQEILQGCFPTRRVVPLDSTNLIWGLGSFHCLTQQEPAE